MHVSEEAAKRKDGMPGCAGLVVCLFVAIIILGALLPSDGGITGTFEGGGGGGATRHVLKVEGGDSIATVLFQGPRKILQVGKRKLKSKDDNKVVWDCEVESYSGQQKGAIWQFTLTLNKSESTYTIDGFNYSVVLRKMSKDESDAFWNK